MGTLAKTMKMMQRTGKSEEKLTHEPSGPPVLVAAL